MSQKGCSPQRTDSQDLPQSHFPSYKMFSCIFSKLLSWFTDASLGKKDMGPQNSNSGSLVREAPPTSLGDSHSTAPTGESKPQGVAAL